MKKDAWFAEKNIYNYMEKKNTTHVKEKLRNVSTAKCPEGTREIVI